MNNTFTVNIIPDDDAERIAVLERYRLLDTPAEKVFDNMTVLTAAIFQCPVALISLVGAEMVFFKSTHGVGNVRCADRGESLCALAILNPETLVFEDTLASAAVAESAPVKHGVRFYAGAPLKTPEGYCIGTVCIAAFQPRKFSRAECETLAALSQVVMEQIELRLKAMTESEMQERLMAQKDEFISVASHELKTPLTSLTAALQVLEKSNEQGTQVTGRMIAQAGKSLKKINSLVADLLNVKRLTSGGLPLNKTVFPIGRLIEECCGHVREQGHHRIHLDGDAGTLVMADQQKIDQVVVNLVNNAVKYAPDAFDIYITVRKEAEFARVDVRDKGPGISGEHQPRLFERYYRSGQHNTSGLGLGLYIVDAIVKQHGGEVGAESEWGKGSTFWFTLPLAQHASISG